jgi:hypothetical protein
MLIQKCNRKRPFELSTAVQNAVVRQGVDGKILLNTVMSK